MEFKVGDKVVITDVTKIDNADGFKSNKPYKVTAVHPETPIISNGEVELDFYEHELQYVQPYKSKKQRITELEKQIERIPVLENEVAELKVIVEQMRTQKAIEPSTDDEVQAQDEIIEFEGNQYRKVDREAREGDVVIFTVDNIHYRSQKPYRVCKEVTFLSEEGKFVTVYNGIKRIPETVDVYERIQQEKSANQLRAEIIEKAKKFVDENLAYGRSINRYKYEGNRTYRSNFYDVDFFVKGNKVTAVVYWLRGNVTRVEKPAHVGRAICSRYEVFNEHIGKAIALGRALGLDVSEFEQAAQPNQRTYGMVMEWRGGTRVIATPHVTGETCDFDSEFARYGTIINDTNAQY